MSEFCNKISIDTFDYAPKLLTCLLFTCLWTSWQQCNILRLHMRFVCICIVPLAYDNFPSFPSVYCQKTSAAAAYQQPHQLISSRRSVQLKYQPSLIWDKSMCSLQMINWQHIFLNVINKVFGWCYFMYCQQICHDKTTTTKSLPDSHSLSSSMPQDSKPYKRDMPLCLYTWLT